MSAKIHYYSLSSTSFIEKCYIFYFFYVLFKNEERFFEKISNKKFAIRVFFVSLQPQNGIGVWCNGNTTDSGPVIPGSNPGTPTIKP